MHFSFSSIGDTHLPKGPLGGIGGGEEEENISGGDGEIGGEEKEDIRRYSDEQRMGDASIALVGHEQC